MTQPLTWNLHGNDQLSGVLEKLDRVLDKLSRRLDEVTADAQRTGRALAATETQVKNLGVQAENAGGHVSSFHEKTASAMAAVGRFAAQAVVAFGIAGGAAAAFGVKAAAANEGAMISFEVLLGSADKAARFLKDLQAFAASTPFELPELRTAASRLLAVGVETRRIIPLLTRLGDATAGMGTGAFGIERAVYALQQMSQAGKVSLEDINQLTDAGIPALDALATRLGTTVAKLRDDISAGKIKPEALFQAIEQGAGKSFQRLDGMMKRQSASLSGMWSTFKDNAGQSLAKFVEPAMPALKKLLDWAATTTPKILGAVQRMGSDISAVFQGSDVPQKLMDSLTKLGERVLPELRNAWGRILKTIYDNKDGLEKLGRFLADYVIPFIGDNLVWAIKAATTAFEGVIWVAAHVVDAVKLMFGIFRTFFEGITVQAEIAFGWIPGIGPKLKEARAKFKEWADGIEDDLDRLDGRTVDINLRINGSVQDVNQRAGERGDRSRRAVGGPAWAGESYTWREFGNAEGFYAAQTGTVVASNPGRANSMGGGGDIIGYLEVVHKTPDGRTMWTELLALKRGMGGRALGLT